MWVHCMRATQNKFRLFSIFLFCNAFLQNFTCILINCMCALLNCTFFIPALRALFFFFFTKLHKSCVRKCTCSQIPSLFYGSVLLPHLRNRKRSVGYDLGRSTPCLEAFKVVELVSLKPSVHLQLIKWGHIQRVELFQLYSPVLF